MTINNALYSSAKEDWETPPELFNELNKEFNFKCDLAANADNHKCDKYYSGYNSSLNCRWMPFDGPFWLNPPYGRDIKKWVKKAYEESKLGAKIVCLLPSRTGAAWFQDYVLGKAEIRFLRGRLKFVGAKHSAPFDSVIAIYGSNVIDTNSVRVLE